MTTIEYLTSLEAVRERCNKVFGLAKENKLQYFNYNEEREVSVAEFCITLLKVRAMIPPHQCICDTIVARLWHRFYEST